MSYFLKNCVSLCKEHIGLSCHRNTYAQYIDALFSIEKYRPTELVIVRLYSVNML